MKIFHEMFLVMLIGAISGLFILGVLGRAITVVLAFFTHNSINLSLNGTIEIFLISAFIGLIGGIILWVFKYFCRCYKLIYGFIIGFILFITSIIFVLFLGKIEFYFSSIQVFTFSIVALLYIMYGVFTSKLLIYLSKLKENKYSNY